MHRESCGIFGLGDGILGEFLARLESLREVVSDIEYFYLCLEDVVNKWGFMRHYI